LVDPPIVVEPRPLFALTPPVAPEALTPSNGSPVIALALAFVRSSTPFTKSFALQINEPVPEIVTLLKYVSVDIVAVPDDKTKSPPDPSPKY
jgi:hypothetical protein